MKFKKTIAFGILSAAVISVRIFIRKFKNKK